MEKFRIQCKNPECNCNRVRIDYDEHTMSLKFVCEVCGATQTIHTVTDLFSFTD